MMNNLFSSFDPSINMTILWMNWLSVTLILMLPSKIWVIPSKMSMLLSSTMKHMHEESKTLMKKKEKMNSIIYSTLFLFLILNNFTGLLPYIFTGTSHMTMNLTMALMLWTSILMFSVINKTNKMMAHLVPSGTPTPLMSFMVMIETISTIIRPIALSVRLSANMIAGHLLLTLIGSTGISMSYKNLIFMLSAQMMLVILEMAVSIIQAYVFSILTILYASEI